MKIAVHVNKRLKKRSVSNSNGFQFMRTALSETL